MEVLTKLKQHGCLCAIVLVLHSVSNYSIQIKLGHFWVVKTF